MTATDHERYEIMLMKRIDGVITAEEQAELSDHVAMCPACKAELHSFGELKMTTDAMRHRILEDVTRDPLVPTLPTRTLNHLGFAVLVLLSALLVGWGGWAVWQDPKIPTLLRMILLAGGGVAVAVFLNIVRLRVRAAPHDPYREIDR